MEGFDIPAANGQVAEKLFGRDGRRLLRPAIEAFARAGFDSEVERWLFASERRSLTCEPALAEGSEVVIKAPPPGTADAGRLRAAQGVQGHLLEQVADYEAARGRRFTTAEHTTIETHWLEMTAYAARVELARERAGLESITAYRDELTRHPAEMAEL